MRNLTILIATLVILGLINFGIYQKQRILKSGETVYLKIAPKDPRSMLQGDYMAFNYDIINEMNQEEHVLYHGYVVIKIDDKKIGHFERIYKNEILNSNEKLIKYQYNPKAFRKFTLKPDSFLFQEGKQAVYQQAQYAVFHYQGNNDYVLIDMADKDLKSLKNQKLLP